AQPDPAEPRPTRPCLAAPCLPCRACPAAPGPAWPGPASPRRGRPRLAQPSRACLAGGPEQPADRLLQVTDAPLVAVDLRLMHLQHHERIRVALLLRVGHFFHPGVAQGVHCLAVFPLATRPVTVCNLRMLTGLRHPVAHAADIPQRAPA